MDAFISQALAIATESVEPFFSDLNYLYFPQFQLNATWRECRAIEYCRLLAAGFLHLSQQLDRLANDESIKPPIIDSLWPEMILTSTHPSVLNGRFLTGIRVMRPSIIDN